MRTSEEMFPVVEDWLQSGLTQKEYSKQRQLPAHILPYWVGRYRQTRSSSQSQTASFIQLSTVPASGHGMESDRRCGSLPDRGGHPLCQHSSHSLSAATIICMFALTASQRFFLYNQPVDMRKAFDGLCGVVQQGMGKDACSGDVYIFLGKRLDRMKLLVWEPSGFVLYYKRLEAGTFHLPQDKQQAITLSYSELSLLLEGVEVEVKHRRKRFKKTSQKV